MLLLLCFHQMYFIFMQKVYQKLAGRQKTTPFIEHNMEGIDVSPHVASSDLPPLSTGSVEDKAKHHAAGHVDDDDDEKQFRVSHLQNVVDSGGAEEVGATTKQQEQLPAAIIDCEFFIL